MGGARVDADVKKMTLEVAVGLLERGKTQFEIAEILAYPEAKGEGLHPYTRGSLAGPLNPESRSQIKADMDCAIIDPIVDKLMAISGTRQKGTTKRQHRQTPLTQPIAPEEGIDKEEPQPQVQEPKIQVQETIPQSESLSNVNTDRQRKTSEAETSEDDILRRVRAMLEDIQVEERPTTARGRMSTLKTVPVALRLPEQIYEELNRLGGKRSNHIEKAIILYLKAINT